MIGGQFLTARIFCSSARQFSQSKELSAAHGYSKPIMADIEVQQNWSARAL